MKRLLSLAAAVCLSVTLSIQAHGEWMTAKQLLAHCERNEAICVGYIMGVEDGYKLYVSKWKYCAPYEVTSDQMRGVFVDYMKSLPPPVAEEMGSAVANIIIEIAFEKAWPCPKN